MSTQKNKSKTKTEIWKLFDSINDAEKLECIYSNEEINNNCKECEAPLCVSEEGFYCCSNISCGIIYKDVIDFGAEWRYYGADDTNSSDPTRCGMPVNPLLKESSFGCKITCNSQSSYAMRTIKRFTDWQAMPYNEKSKYDDFNIITILSSMEGIPKIIIDDAIRYYNKISNEKTYRGLNRDGLLAASIYIACSINENPRTAKEIAHIFKLDNTSATRGCKNALSILNDIEVDDLDKTELHNSTPSTFIHRYCSKLSINNELTQLCMFIASIVEKKKLILENTPHSISAGIVYFVCQKCGLNISKNSVHKVSKISEVTINKCYKKLEIHEKMLLPSIIIKKYIV